jgi:hypothetical protein
MRQEFLVAHEEWNADNPRSPGLGPAAAIQTALEEEFGPTTWELGQGLFDGDGFSFLANLGVFPEVSTLTLETWGRNNPATAIALWCKRRGWKAINLADWKEVSPIGRRPTPMAYVARLVFALVFGSLAAFLMWATRKAAARRRLWLNDGVLVDGEIVGFKERPRASTRAGRIPVAPVVSYRTAGPDSELKRFTSAEASFPNPFALGQRVPVRYMAGDARAAELDSAVRGWTFILAIGTLAAACLVVALIPLVVTVMELRH